MQSDSTVVTHKKKKAEGLGGIGVACCKLGRPSVLFMVLENKSKRKYGTKMKRLGRESYRIFLYFTFFVLQLEGFERPFFPTRLVARKNYRFTFSLYCIVCPIQTICSYNRQASERFRQPFLPISLLYHTILILIELIHAPRMVLLVAIARIGR